MQMTIRLKPHSKYISICQKLFGPCFGDLTSTCGGVTPEILFSSFTCCPNLVGRWGFLQFYFIKTLHSTSCYSAPLDHLFIFYGAEVVLLLDFFCLMFQGDEVNLPPGFLSILSCCSLEVFHLRGFYVFYPLQLSSLFFLVLSSIVLKLTCCLNFLVFNLLQHGSLQGARLFGPLASAGRVL